MLKHITNKYKLDLNGIAFTSLLVSVLVLFPVFLFQLSQNSIISTSNEGYIFMLASIATNSIALYLVFRAVKIGELSIVGPLDTVRPIIITFLSVIFLSEVLKVNILAAALLTTIGGFIIHYKTDFFGTLRNISNSKASLLMIGNSFVQSLSAVFDKLALQSINTGAYTFFLLFGMFLVYAAIVYRKRLDLRKFVNIPIVGMGGLKIISSFGIVSAVALVSPAVAITAQMSRAVLMALLGYWFFADKNIMKKLIGAAIMVAGVVLLFM